MNRHDDSTDRIRTWLHQEGQGELPDWVLRETFEATRATPQRHGLSGWLASIRGHRGTSARRRTDLFTIATISAVAVTALFAINTFVDVAEPDGLGAENPPVITTEDQMFSGRFAYGPGCTDASGEEIPDCWQQTGVRFDDPRFEGTIQMRANADHTMEDVYVNQFTITTEEGAWVGDAVPGLLTSPDDGVPSVHLFTGEGAYEGLHAIASIDLTAGVFEVEGRVVHGGFPELP